MRLIAGAILVLAGFILWGLGAIVDTLEKWGHIYNQYPAPVMVWAGVAVAFGGGAVVLLEWRNSRPPQS